MEDNPVTQEKRHFGIRLLAGVFWLLLTMLLGLALVGGIVGGTVELNTTGMTFSEAYSVGQSAGGEASMQFMEAHSGKAILSLFISWLVLSFLGVYPWVSKYKK